MVVGGHSKKAGEEEPITQTIAAIEDDKEGAQLLDADEEVKDLSGNKKSKEDMHVFPITTGTIVF